ncbi:MAG: hypothetical protein ACE5GF_00510 [Thermodesulfobacteriota bacterium]
MYHVQTEDGGSKNPVVTTTLFKDGVTVTTKRSGYSDMLHEEGLAERVGELMREQHSGMIRRLMEGHYDAPSKRSPEGVQPPPVKKEESTPLASDGEKGLDEIILEYLSMGEKK